MTWELSKTPAAVTPQAAVPDEGYECKVSIVSFGYFNN